MKQITGIAASLLVMTSVAGCAGQSAVLPETGITHDADYPPALVDMNFQSHGKRLNGLVYVADGPGPHPTVLLLHGFPGNEKILTWLRISARTASMSCSFTIAARGAARAISPSRT